MDISDVGFAVHQIKESEKLTAQEKQLLHTLCVTLRNPVLPQHEIESRAGSRPPSHEEIEMFTKIHPLKKGCYIPSEDQKIVSNWKAFCKLHNWDSRNVHPFLMLREDNRTYIRSKRQRRKFVQFLADGLPDRTLYSVYHRFRNLYTNNLHRRFLPEEDNVILDHLENNANLDEKRKYSDLAKVLKRTRASIWRRYRILKRKRQAEAKLELTY